MPNALHLNVKMVDFSSSYTGLASVLGIFLDEQKSVLSGDSLPGRELEKPGPKMQIFKFIICALLFMLWFKERLQTLCN